MVPAEARSVDVLGADPLISKYEERVVIWAGHGPRQPPSLLLRGTFLTHSRLL